MELVSRTELFPSLVYEIAAEELVDETVEILKQSNFPEETPYVTDTFFMFLGKIQVLLLDLRKKVNSALGEIEYAVPF